MRDPKRIPEILDLLGKYWAAHPDLRLGQVLDNAKYSIGLGATSTFYVEDENIKEALELLVRDTTAVVG